MENEFVRESMVFYSSFYEAIHDLPAEEFKKTACALFEYGLYSKMPETCGIEKTIMILAKPQIDKNIQRWNNAKKSHMAKNVTADADENNCDDVVFAEDVSKTTQKEVPEQQKQKSEPLKNNQSVKEPEASQNEQTESVQDTSCQQIENVREQPSGKGIFGEYRNVFLSQAEVRSLIEEYGSDVYADAVKYLSRYLKRKPTHKSACHFEDIRGWVIRAVRNEKSSRPPTKFISGNLFDGYSMNDFYENPDNYTERAKTG